MAGQAGLLELSAGSELLLGGAEWTVTAVEAQYGRVLLRSGGEERWRSIRWLAHHPDCRAVPDDDAGAPSPAARRQPPVLDDLTDLQRQVVWLRVAHLLEAETEFRSGDPLRPESGEPRPGYDPRSITLGQGGGPRPPNSTPRQGPGRPAHRSKARPSGRQALREPAHRTPQTLRPTSQRIHKQLGGYLPIAACRWATMRDGAGPDVTCQAGWSHRLPCPAPGAGQRCCPGDVPELVGWVSTTLTYISSMAAKVKKPLRPGKQARAPLGDDLDRAGGQVIAAADNQQATIRDQRIGLQHGHVQPTCTLTKFSIRSPGA